MILAGRNVVMGKTAHDSELDSHFVEGRQDEPSERLASSGHEDAMNGVMAEEYVVSDRAKHIFFDTT